MEELELDERKTKILNATNWTFPAMWVRYCTDIHTRPGQCGVVQ